MSDATIKNKTALLDDQVVDRKYREYIKNNNTNAIESSFRTIAGVVAGSLINAVTIALFINPGGFLPGGLSGLVVLLQRLIQHFTGIVLPFAPISIGFNILAALFAVRTLGKKFTLYSFLSVLIYSFATDMIPPIHFTDDRILLAVFGGILGGTGLGLVLNSGASQGGSDFIAMTYSVKKGINTFGYVMIFNIILMLISGAIFGMESALYTIIFLFVSNEALNVIYTRYSKKTLLIITEHAQEVADDIRTTTNHSCTILTGEGGFSHEQTKMVYMIIRADEVNFVRRRIRAIDEKAFINVLNSSLVTGNFYIRSLK